MLQKPHPKQGQTVFGTAALPETKPLDPIRRKKSEVSGHDFAIQNHKEITFIGAWQAKIP